MSSFTLNQLLAATAGEWHGQGTDAEFSGVSTDSRSLQAGELFVALRGERFDGHRFLEDVRVRRARAALVERLDPASPLTQIRVADTTSALGDLASSLARRHKARRVAITGSNGKTTTKELTRAALSASGNVVASRKSFNNFVGVPLTLFEVRPETDFAVLELGTSKPGEIDRLARLVAPQVGVITNCGQAHLGMLGGADGVVLEKGALLDHLPSDGVAILNSDDPAFDKLRSRARCRVVSFGIRHKADFRAVDIRFDLRRLVFSLAGERVFVPLGGCHNVYNALAALAVAEVMKVPIGSALQKLRSIEGPPMRLSPIRTRRLLIVDDSYNANPGSVEAAFRTFAAVPLRGRRVVVLGDMLELGKDSAALHFAAGRLASLSPLDRLIAVGRFAGHVREGAIAAGLDEGRIDVCADAVAAAQRLRTPGLLRKGDCILVKGSRGMTLEVVVEALQELGESDAD